MDAAQHSHTETRQWRRHRGERTVYRATITMTVQWK